MSEEFTTYNGTIKDLDILVDHRLRMWYEIHPELESKTNSSEGQTRKWIKRKIEDGKLVSFIVKNRTGKILGSGCIVIKEDQPRPSSTRMDYPYLLSMFTEEKYRRMGVASLIVESAIKWSKEHGYDRISLHSSKYGQGLYSRFGFEKTNEMRLKLF